MSNYGCAELHFQEWIDASCDRDLSRENLIQIDRGFTPAGLPRVSEPVSGLVGVHARPHAQVIPRGSCYPTGMPGSFRLMITMIHPLVTVRDLTAEFNDRKVLEGISFEIMEGETPGVIGRSCAGKTVPMHLLIGIDEPPAAGRVIYHRVVCTGCGFITVPSQVDAPCPACGKPRKVRDIDLWDPSMNGRKEQVLRRTATMFQRTLAHYGDDRVIETILRALDDVGYPQGCQPP